MSDHVKPVAPTATPAPTPPPPGTHPPPPRRLRLWRELVYLLAVYFVYSTVRNQFGSNGGSPGEANATAFRHAVDIIDLERGMHLLFEPAFQRWYLDLPAHGAIQFWNVFYGTAHFAVTAGALVWLFLADPERYPRLRNTLMFTTLLALIGFATFSLMPPRLLSAAPGDFGPPAGSPSTDTTFVDTVETFETFWSFDSGTVRTLSNQYAAMPSMHIGWSTWSALVLAPMVRRRWLKALIWMHPVATFVCIVVTGNHYWLDAIGGLLALGTGALLASQFSAWLEQRRTPKSSRPTTL